MRWDGLKTEVPIGSPYDGLGIETWRKVMVRLVVFKAARPNLARLHNATEDGSCPRVHTALGHIYTASGGLGAATSDDEALAELVDEVSAPIERLREGTAATSEERELTQALLDAVSDAYAHDPFEDLLHRISGFAADVYGDDWAEPKPGMVLLGLHPRHKSGGKDPYALGATTRLGEPPVVELAVVPEQFKPATYAVIPTVLVHECVCHVPTPAGHAIDNASRFAEGFMDWVAVYFFDRWIDLIDADLVVAADEHAGEYRHLLDQASDPETAARRAGHRAARRLVAWMREHGGIEHDEAHARVARIGIEMNVLDRALVEKDRFVSHLEGRSLPAELEKRLRLWLKSRATAADLLL